jgi:hypothetical protein
MASVFKRKTHVVEIEFRFAGHPFRLTDHRLSFDHMGFFMNVLQYLQTKYKREQPHAITRFEAEAFGIPYPLKPGWLKTHGSREVTEFMLSRVKKGIDKIETRRARKGRKISEYQQQALNIISKKSGPVSYPAILKAAVVSVPPRQRYVDPNSPEFLTSYAWRTLRMQALKKYGAVCMCCGDSPANGAVMNVDHIKPRKHFPQLALAISNLQILCGACNQGKANWDETDWRPAMLDVQSYDPLEQAREFLKGF